MASHGCPVLKRDFWNLSSLWPCHSESLVWPLPLSLHLKMLTTESPSANLLSLSVLSPGPYLLFPLTGSGIAPQTKPITPGLLLQLSKVPYFTSVLKLAITKHQHFQSHHPASSVLRAESNRASLSLVLHPPSCLLLKGSWEPHPLASRRRHSSSKASVGRIPTPSKHRGLLSEEKGELCWSETPESPSKTRGTTIDIQRKIPSIGEVLGSEAMAMGGTTRTL